MADEQGRWSANDELSEGLGGGDTRGLPEHESDADVASEVGGGMTGAGGTATETGEADRNWSDSEASGGATYGEAGSSGSSGGGGGLLGGSTGDQGGVDAFSDDQEQPLRPPATGDPVDWQQ